MSKAIQTADLDWQCIDGIEVPISKHFGDVYFSRDNGLLESQHVFLNGNDLKTRLKNLNDFEYFCVGETGFGTGLNILALWQLWQHVRPNNQSHLHVITVEKFPLSKEDLTRALDVWTELNPIAKQLLAQYPLPIAGCQRLNFPRERFSIDLWLGDAQDVLPSIPKTHPINAWFLDGFSPACNPDIWSGNVLDHVIRLSDIGTTFSSFSVAGVLKRGLTQHGISISRPRGFGHKNEMLKAVWNAPEQLKNTELKSSAIFKQRQIAIIGAGIAGLNCAWTFAQRGHQVMIYDQSAPLAGASGNPLALLNPKLSPIEQSSEHLMTLSWQFALNHYKKFKAFRPISVNQLVQKDPQESLDLALQYSQTVFEYQTAVQLKLTTQFDNLKLKHAGAIYPQQLCDQILDHPLIHFQQAEISDCLKLENSQIQILNHIKEEIGAFDHVVVCCAGASKNFFSYFPRLRPIRGQVSWLENVGHTLDQQQAYSFGGYCMQLDTQRLIIGASFYPEREDSEVLLEDHVHNYDLIHSAFPEYAESLAHPSEWQGRASVRSQTLDYFPVVGQVDDDQELYTFSGLGSKGFLFAPLCSEILAALVLKEACPIPQDLLNKLRPTRGKKKIRIKKPYYQAPIDKAILD